jgi:hypothetical protein
LHGFLGLVGYYRRFIQDFGAIAAPLTQLLWKNAFQWTEEVAAAFDALKGPCPVRLFFIYQILARSSW